MKIVLEVAAAAAAAVLLFSILVLVHPSLVLIVNPFSVVVVYLAIIKGDISGAVAGTVCGLVQDAFSIGVFGLAGLTKTVMGFLAGSISRKINIAPPSRRFLFVFVLSAGELTLWAGIGRLISARGYPFGNELMLLQPPAVALAAVLAFQLPQWIKMLRKSRSSHG